MRRVYESGASQTVPTVTGLGRSAGYPGKGDADGGTAGTVIGPYWFHLVTESIVGVIEEAGLTPSDVPEQFRDAVRQLIAGQTDALSGATFIELAEYLSQLNLPAGDNSKRIATTEWVRDRTCGSATARRTASGTGDKVTDVTFRAVKRGNQLALTLALAYAPDQT